MRNVQAVSGLIRDFVFRRLVGCLATGCLLSCGIVASAYGAVPVIDTIAGGGTSAGNGDGGPATSARLDHPLDVAIDAAGNVYIAEWYAFRVRKVTPGGVISTVAGNGAQAYNGDGIPATEAGIDARSVAVDSTGNLYIADAANGRVRKVSGNGIISTVMDSLSLPTNVSVDAQGAVYAVSGNRVLKKGSDGVIRAVAGNGEYGFSGDGGPATAAMLASPEGISFDAAGNLYIADFGNDRIRRVTPGGVISTVVGGGWFVNDPVAKSIRLQHPHDVVVDSRGNIYIAEQRNLIRVVSARGFIKTAVGQFDETTFGNGGAPEGFAGDGGPATDALIHEPMGLVLDPTENLYLVDSQNSRIRRVTTIPTPADVAGANAFEPHESYAVGSFTNNVAIADVNGDGRQDALLTTSSWGSGYEEPDRDFKLWVFLQKADGSLATPLRYPLFGDPIGGRSGTGIAATDLDRDGFADVVVGTLKGITVFRGTAAGLAAGTEYAGFENAEPVVGLAILDMNRDGNPDVVTMGGGRSEGGSSPDDEFGLTVFIGNGAGGVSRRTFHPRPDEYGWKFIRTSDINGDGLPDLTSAWTELPNTALFKGGFEVTYHDGVDGFRPPVRFAVSQPGVWGAAYAVGDFNKDGRKDAVVSISGNWPDAEYAYLQQRPDGAFVDVRRWTAFDLPDEMLAADMNGDGRDDLLVLHSGWSAVGYFQQTASGLGAEVKYLIRESANQRFPALAIGDLNDDGCKDIAVADRNQGLIVLRGRNCIVAKPMNGAQPFVPPPRNGLRFGTAGIPDARPVPSFEVPRPGALRKVGGAEDFHLTPTASGTVAAWLRRVFSPWLLVPVFLGVLLGSTYFFRVRRI